MLNAELNALCQVGNLSADAMVIYDLRNRVVRYINKSGAKLFGIPAGYDVRDTEPAIHRVLIEDRGHVKQQFEKVNKKSGSAEFEFRMRNLGEEVRYVCCNVYAILNDQYLVVTLQDITRAKQHEEHIIEYGTKKNTLLDSLIHNLSGALSMMKNLTTQAGKASESLDNERLRKYLTLVNENSTYCLSMINELLSSENDQITHVSVKTKRFEVREKVGYIFEELANTHQDRKFIFDVRCSPCIANTDDVKLLQVLVNFLSNAVKFTHNDGVIALVVEDIGDFLQFSVTDNGIGIPEALQPYIYDRKGKAGRPGLNGEKSIGLGLSINKMLIQMLGGELSMESEEGKGTTFFFTVPN